MTVEELHMLEELYPKNEYYLSNPEGKTLPIMSDTSLPMDYYWNLSIGRSKYPFESDKFVWGIEEVVIDYKNMSVDNILNEL